MIAFWITHFFFFKIQTFKSKNTRQGNNQAWLPKLFKQMKGSKEQTLEKKDFYYNVDSLY
jgi:hypothetical protein